MDIMFGFISIGIITLLAAMGPGADFAIVMKNSLSHSRRIGILTAIGIGLGIFVHVAYSLMGIGLIVSQSVMLFSIIKLLGAAYLIYLGLHMLRSQPRELSPNINLSDTLVMNPTKAIRQGFLTNALNPKVTLFFLAVFTQMIDPGTPLWVQFAYGVEMSLVSIAWFSVLSFMLTTAPAKRVFTRIQHYFERAMGGILIAFGLKVALSTRE